MARPFSYHILTPAMLPGWSLFYVHTCIPSLSPLNHNNSSTSKNQWMIPGFFYFFIGGFGIIFKKNPTPPRFYKKTSKKLIPFLQNTNPAEETTHETHMPWQLLLCRLSVWSLGSKVRKHQASGWKMRLSGIPRCFFDHETKLVNLV